MGMWKLARALNCQVYSVTGGDAFSRDFGFGNQMRRASISIASNIAEGFESQSNPSFVRFLAIARGSAAEVRAHLYLALDLQYLSVDQFHVLYSSCELISRQITGLINYLKRNGRKE